MTRRPARYEDLVKGAKIVVIDAEGKEVSGTVDIYGYVSIKESCRTRCGGEGGDNYPWCFWPNDFIDGKHGDYGLKLYVDDPKPDPVDLVSLGILLRIRASSAWPSVEADLQASITTAIKEQL